MLSLGFPLVIVFVLQEKKKRKNHRTEVSWAMFITVLLRAFTAFYCLLYC